MARADASPKAIIKAAIRNKCHAIAAKYPDLQLEQLHGSNVRWLVLSDELFNEVCTDFTISKLNIENSKIRTIFDAEWVSQVTYELITKPGRPRWKASPSSDPSSSPSSPPSPFRQDNLEARQMDHAFRLPDRAMAFQNRPVEYRQDVNGSSYFTTPEYVRDSILPWQSSRTVCTNGQLNTVCRDHTESPRVFPSSSHDLITAGIGSSTCLVQQRWIDVVLN